MNFKRCNPLDGRPSTAQWEFGITFRGAINHRKTRIVLTLGIITTQAIVRCDSSEKIRIEDRLDAL